MKNGRTSFKNSEIKPRNFSRSIMINEKVKLIHFAKQFNKHLLNVNLQNNVEENDKVIRHSSLNKTIDTFSDNEAYFTYKNYTLSNTHHLIKNPKQNISKNRPGHFQIIPNELRETKDHVPVVELCKQ